MKVQLQETDVVVYESVLTVLDEDRETPCDRKHNVQVVCEEGQEAYVYTLLWTTWDLAGKLTSGPSIMWRGDFNSTLREFGDIVGDLVAEKMAGRAANATLTV